jgi:methyl-galactoside transport system ATP-binding protein
MNQQCKYVLEMLNISKSFPGVQALDNASLKIRPASIHAIMGENGAGKSTLMKCLFGIYTRDKGEIFHNGNPVHYNGTLDAIKDHIAMIHQELHPEPHLSVMENVWMGRLPLKGITVDFKKMEQDTQTILNRLKVAINPRTMVKKLSVSHIQSIEIAKAVSFGAEVIIMDEPTSSLASEEVELLFGLIRELQADGVSIIYISHKIDEIKRIANEVTIMRDGKTIGTWNIDDISENMLISKMVGRDISNRFPPRNHVPGDVYMKVENYTSIHDGSFRDVSFELRTGEILGIGGLIGAQRTELIESMFGLRAVKAGRLLLDGKEVKIHNPRDAMSNEIALLTEDRKSQGLFAVLSVVENIYIASYKKLAKFMGYINSQQCNAIAKKRIEQLSIKTPNIRTPANFLSGGNQQKVLIARWLETEPKILLLDEPTRGIDVGAKYEIYKIIENLAQEGKCVIFISSEMVELIGMADRILVMCEGRKTGELLGEDITEENILKLATKFMV